METQTTEQQVNRLYRYFLASADTYYAAVGERDVCVSINPQGELRIWGEMHGAGTNSAINLCEVFLEYGMYCHTWKDSQEATNVMRGFGEFIGDSLANYMKTNIKFDSTKNPGACALECILESINAQINIEQVGPDLSFIIADCPIQEVAQRTGLRDVELAYYGFNVMVQSLLHSIDPGISLNLPSNASSKQVYSIKLQELSEPNQLAGVHPFFLREWRVFEGEKFDAFAPPEMAHRVVEAGVKKSVLDIPRMFTLATLAGGFIAMGAAFSVTVIEGMSALPHGLVRLVSGLAFTLGLIMVVVAGSELFTGNNLIIMAYLSHRVTLKGLVRNWSIVYLGNFVGAITIVFIMLLTKQYTLRNGTIGITMLNIGEAKTSLEFFQAVALGIMCNALVCLAVWMCFSARNTVDKILAIIPPIAAFVASGFEHSVANMYFIPAALFIKFFGSSSFFETIQKSPLDYPHLTWKNFLIVNLLPVTIGNIIGGALMIGFIYWFLYIAKSIRPRFKPTSSSTI